MPFDSLKAQLSMLINDITNQPQDVHELYEMLHLKLMELRNTGQPIPADLLEVEKMTEALLAKRANNS